VRFETIAVLGAIAVLGWVVWQRSRPTVALETLRPASPLTDAISGAAWRTSDPLGWLSIRVPEKEEELL
jgi:hypothetical protein